MEVVKGLERRWDNLTGELYVLSKKIAEITSTNHNDIQRMEAVVDHFVRYDPLRSWDRVARALQGMGLHQQGDVVIAKYVRGI